MSALTRGGTYCIGAYHPAIHEGTQTPRCSGSSDADLSGMEQLFSFSSRRCEPYPPLLEAASIARIIERPLGHDPMQTNSGVMSP